MGAIMKGIILRWTSLRKPPNDGQVGASYWPNLNRSWRAEEPTDRAHGDQPPRTQNSTEKGGRTDLEGQRIPSTDHP